MTYHVYQPTIEGEKRWGYYCRIDGRKKTVIKYPRTRKPFASQEDVESWIAELREGEAGGQVKVKDVAEHLFDAEGEWATRQARRREGRRLAQNTLYEHAMIVRKHIIPRLGEEAIVDVKSDISRISCIPLSSPTRLGATWPPPCWRCSGRHSAAHHPERSPDRDAAEEEPKAEHPELGRPQEALPRGSGGPAGGLGAWQNGVGGACRGPSCHRSVCYHHVFRRHAAPRSTSREPIAASSGVGDPPGDQVDGRLGQCESVREDGRAE